jgi:hypothetical protein
MAYPLVQNGLNQFRFDLVVPRDFAEFHNAIDGPCKITRNYLQWKSFSVPESYFCMPEDLRRFRFKPCLQRFIARKFPVAPPPFYVSPGVL